MFLDSMMTALEGGNPSDAILRQEASEQRRAVASARLPVDIRGKEKWESLGFKFGPPIDGDPIFCEATFPAGWTVQPTEHSSGRDYSDDVPDGYVRACVWDSGKVIFATEPEAIGDRRPWDIGELHVEQARAWMLERYPDAEDALAYWDD